MPAPLLVPFGPPGPGCAAAGWPPKRGGRAGRPSPLSHYPTGVYQRLRECESPPGPIVPRSRCRDCLAMAARRACSLLGSQRRSATGTSWIAHARLSDYPRALGLLGAGRAVPAPAAWWGPFPAAGEGGRGRGTVTMRSGITNPHNPTASFWSRSKPWSPCWSVLPGYSSMQPPAAGAPAARPITDPVAGHHRQI